MNLVEYPDREMMMIDLANKLAGELNSILMHEENATLVVPGGTTPGPIFDTLCAAVLDWDRVFVMLSDERWVPETSERSNTKLLKERLLIDRAAAAGSEEIRVMLPATDWLVQALRRRGFELHPVRLYAKSL